MAKNIEMNYKQNDGSYEVLYPKTLPELTGCLPLSGGTMTGDLVLNQDPTSNLQAVTKQYVDVIGNQVNNLFQILAYTGDGADTKRLNFNGTPQLIVIISKTYNSDSRDNGLKIFGVGIRGNITMPIGFYYNATRYWNCGVSWGSNYVTLSDGAGSYTHVPNVSGSSYLCFAFLT